MRNKTYDTFDAAVADIPDGATIMFSGFAGPGTPRNLIAALHRQGAKGLTTISNTPGGGMTAAAGVRSAPGGVIGAVIGAARLLNNE